MKSDETEVADQQFIFRVYEEYKRLMYATVNKYISDFEVKEDLIQETLLRLIPKATMLREMSQSALSTYIVYTVRNLAFNYLRDKAVENRHIPVKISETLDEICISDSRAVESMIIEAENIKQFRSILKQLPDKEQELLIKNTI